MKRLIILTLILLLQCKTFEIYKDIKIGYKKNQELIERLEQGEEVNHKEILKVLKNNQIYLERASNKINKMEQYAHDLKKENEQLKEYKEKHFWNNLKSNVLFFLLGFVVKTFLLIG